jgi:hypothetical protein
MLKRLVILLLFCILSLIGGLILSSSSRVASFIKDQKSIYKSKSKCNELGYSDLSNENYKLDTLSFQIDSSSYSDLEKMRYNACFKGVKAFSYVSSDLHFRKEKFKAKIRIKGDRRIHFGDTSKWSFRVKSKQGTVYGTKKFSLHHPKAKNYGYEWMFHSYMEYYKVLHPTYKFVYVKVNELDLGLYAFEEHFTPNIYKKQSRPKGPVFRFKEGYIGNETLAPIEVIKRTRKYENSDVDVKRGRELIELFVNNQIKVSEAFDIDVLTKYFVVSDLMQCHHANSFKSFFMYYNPVKDRIEPISYDGHYGAESSVKMAGELGVDIGGTFMFDCCSNWLQLFFNNEENFDTAFVSMYYQRLEEYSSTESIDRFLTTIKSDLDQNLYFLYKDGLPFFDHISSFGPEYHCLDNSIIYEHSDYIRKKLNSTKIKVYCEKKERNALYVSNFGGVNVRLMSISDGKETLKFEKEEIIFVKVPSLKHSTKKYSCLKK